MPRRKQPYPIVKMTGGVDTREDPIFLADKTATDLNCVRFHKGIVKKDVGFANFGADPTNAYPLSGTPMHIDTFYTKGGSAFNVLWTNTHFYVYQANGIWQISNSNDANQSHIDFTGDVGNRWQAVPALSNAGNDWLLFTNGKDDIQYWPGEGNCANLAGVDEANENIQARAIGQFKTCTLLGGTIEDGSACPYRVRWSNYADPEDWTIALGGPGFLDLADTVDWVVGFALLQDRCFVFKERSIWELAFVGGSRVFVPEMVVDGIGTYAPRSVISLGNELLFYGTDSVYTFDGRQVRSVGEQIRGLLYEADTRIVDAAKAERAAAQYIEEIGAYYLVLPTTGDTPDLFLTYNLDYDCWAKRTHDICAIGFETEGSGNRWQDETPTWANMTGYWMTRKLFSGAPTTLIVTSDGYVKEDNRQTNEANENFSFTTKDFIWEHAVRVVEFRVQAKSSGNFWVQYSTDAGNSWSKHYNFANKANFTECYATINETCQKIRFRIQSAANTFEFKWIEPWFIPRSRSVSMSRT